jgi:hypothetical protein
VEAKYWDGLEEKVKEKVRKILMENGECQICSGYIVMRLIGVATDKEMVEMHEVDVWETSTAKRGRRGSRQWGKRRGKRRRMICPALFRAIRTLCRSCCIIVNADS